MKTYEIETRVANDAVADVEPSTLPGGEQAVTLRNWAKSR